MDGNGRWAHRRGLPRVAGHRAGAAAVHEAVETAARLGLEVLSLYAFSQENWRRPRGEITTLMGLLREYLRKELRVLQDAGVRLRVIGRTSSLSSTVRDELTRAEAATAGNPGMVLNVALS